MFGERNTDFIAMGSMERGCLVRVVTSSHGARRHMLVICLFGGLLFTSLVIIYIINCWRYLRVCFVTFSYECARGYDSSCGFLTLALL